MSKSNHRKWYDTDEYRYGQRLTDKKKKKENKFQKRRDKRQEKIREKNQYDSPVEE